MASIRDRQGILFAIGFASLLASGAGGEARAGALSIAGVHQFAGNQGGAWVDSVLVLGNVHGAILATGSGQKGFKPSRQWILPGGIQKPVALPEGRVAAWNDSLGMVIADVKDPASASVIWSSGLGKVTGTFRLWKDTLAVKSSATSVRLFRIGAQPTFLTEFILDGNLSPYADFSFGHGRLFWRCDDNSFRITAPDGTTRKFPGIAIGQYQYLHDHWLIHHRYEDSLRLLDITQPDAPVVVTATGTWNNRLLSRVVKRGDTLLAAGTFLNDLVDLSALPELRKIARVPVADFGLGVLIQGPDGVVEENSFSGMYSAGWKGDSLAITDTLEFYRTGYAGGAADGGLIALYGFQNAKAWVFQTSGGAPKLAAELAFPKNVAHLALKDSLLVVVGSEFLRVYDLHAPAAPALVGQWTNIVGTDYDRFYNRVATDGRRAYVLNDLVRTVQVFGPGSPTGAAWTRLGEWVAPSGSRDLAVSEGRVYTAEGARLFAAADLSNPASPQSLFTDAAQASSGAGYRIAAAGKRAWVLTNTLELRTYSLDDPGSIRFLGRQDQRYDLTASFPNSLSADSSEVFFTFQKYAYALERVGQDSVRFRGRLALASPQAVLRNRDGLWAIDRGAVVSLGMDRNIHDPVPVPSTGIRAAVQSRPALDLQAALAGGRPLARIRLPEGSRGLLKVLDMQGRVLFRKGVERTQEVFLPGSLRTGTLILTLEVGGERLSRLFPVFGIR